MSAPLEEARRNRSSGRAALLAVYLVLVSSWAGAQSPAAHPVTVIIPFAPGGGADVATRAIVHLMGQELKTRFVVDNRPGANSFIGAQMAARAAPDGHTLFMTSLTTHSINPHLYKSLPYKLSDFTPVGLLAVTSPVLFVRPGSVSSVKALMAQSIGKDGGLDMGVPNASSRFATDMFASLSGTKVTRVNYNSTPQAHAEVVAGRLDAIFGDFSAGGNLAEAGRLKPLAVAGPRRLTMQPDIPTMAEAGVPGVEVEIWAGLFAPQGTSQDQVNRLNTALNNALQDPQVREMFRKGAQDIRTLSPAEFGRYVDEQYAHWGRMAQRLQIQPE
jgi:tripartite-type tricarboxylate transporter receptor subunit TctC